jgi:hypothetical protein
MFPVTMLTGHGWRRLANGALWQRACAAQPVLDRPKRWPFTFAPRAPAVGIQLLGTGSATPNMKGVPTKSSPAVSGAQSARHGCGQMTNHVGQQRCAQHRSGTLTAEPGLACNRRTDSSMPACNRFLSTPSLRASSTADYDLHEPLPAPLPSSWWPPVCASANAKPCACSLDAESLGLAVTISRLDLSGRANHE